MSFAELRARFAKRRVAGRRGRLAVGLALAAAPLGALLALQVASYAVTLPPELLDPSLQGGRSVRVLDREGHLLREVRADDGARSAWVTAADAALVGQALVATEDRRFYRHAGVDYVAVLRALASDVRPGGVVSGASTLTMQLARAVRPHPRTLWGKFLEAALALRIERAMSKERILEAYENRVSFGPNLRGVGAASRAYFDKPPAALSLGEAALLAALVRGPSYYDLRKHPTLAAARRRTVLSRMVDAGLVERERADVAASEPIVLQTRAPAFGAPHFVRALLAGRLGDVPAAGGGEITTTLDGATQRAAEVAAQRAVGSLAGQHVTAAAVVVLDNATGDILAYVGSPDFFDEARAGQNDGVQARRQPGSTLKPFVYELAMERLGMTPATVLPDLELHLSTPAGDFSPHDYDEAFRGPVRLREALGDSLNVPAVYVADRLGPAAVLERLRALGLSLDRSADDYGAAIALGDGEVSLLELAGAYATLARGGVRKDARATRAVRVGPSVTATPSSARQEERVMPELEAARITDVLKDATARLAAFGPDSVLDLPFDVAAKTGTSKGYRDNWTVGFTRQVTVAAWVGNFDGSPMEHVSGIAGAGPLFHEVMAAVMAAREKLPLSIEPDGEGGALERVAICPLSGERVTPDCPGHVFEWLRPFEANELAFCETHERVTVDANDGLRVGRGGAGDGAACRPVTRTFERYAPRYAAWAATAGRPLAPETFSPACPDHGGEPSHDGAGGPIAIRYPLDGARFVIDPDRALEAQVLSVSVVAPAGARDVELLVDGTPVDREATARALRWPLVEGDHVLVARAGTAESSRVAIHVRL